MNLVDARGAASLDEARLAIDAAGPGTVVALAGDVEDSVHVAALVSAAAGLGRFELLVNNAGTLGPTSPPPIVALRSGDLERTLAVNVVASLRGSSRPPSPTCGSPAAPS